jgi:hypothetical protein
MAKQELIAERVSGILYLINGMTKLFPGLGTAHRRLVGLTEVDVDPAGEPIEASHRLPRRTTLIVVVFAALLLYRSGSTHARRSGTTAVLLDQE